MNPNAKRLLGLMLAIIVCLCCTTAPFRTYAALPNHLRLFEGEHKQLNLVMPVQAQATVDRPDILKVNGQSETSFRLSLQKPISLQSSQTGQAELKLKLFGGIPLKTLKVNVVPNLRVVPGGRRSASRSNPRGFSSSDTILFMSDLSVKYRRVKKRASG